MPLGPIGMLCIKHALNRGMWSGIMAGLGTALADAAYGAIAAFGVGLISHILEHHFLWMEAFGAAVLCGVGIHNIRAFPPHLPQMEISYRSPLKILLSTFLLTLANPLTLLCFAGVYAAFGICCGEETFETLLILTSGILLGAATWWLFLSLGLHFIKRAWGIKPSPWLTRLSGMIILVFGLFTCLDVLKRLFI